MTTNRYSPPNYNDHPEHGERGFEDMCGHGAQGGTSPSFMVQEIGIFCDFLRSVLLFDAILDGIIKPKIHRVDP